MLENIAISIHQYSAFTISTPSAQWNKGKKHLSGSFFLLHLFTTKCQYTFILVSPGGD